MRQVSDEEMEILRQLPSNVSGIKEDEPEQVIEDIDITDEIEDIEISNTLQENNNKPAAPSTTSTLASMIGQKVGYKEREEFNQNEMQDEARRHGVVIGANIFDRADIKDGWQVLDRSLFGERDIYYPRDWEFRIRPATVEAIRNWSTIDDENLTVVDDVFNEIIKSCFSIKTPQGLIPWGNLRSWDRFFVLMLIKEYSMSIGESKISFNEECPECENEVTFELNSTTLAFDLPDTDLLRYYDPEKCVWMIDPAEYDVPGEPFTLYLPTLEKDANIKQWMIERVRANKKIDNVFLKFLPWMAPSISKNLEIATRQIKDYERKFKSYDIDMFTFMNDVITNIIVMPSPTLTIKCPTCGEEVTANIRFPNGVNELFNIKRTGKQFGSKTGPIKFGAR